MGDIHMHENAFQTSNFFSRLRKQAELKLVSQSTIRNSVLEPGFIKSSDTIRLNIVPQYGKETQNLCGTSAYP